MAERNRDRAAPSDADGTRDVRHAAKQEAWGSAILPPCRLALLTLLFGAGVVLRSSGTAQAAYHGQPASPEIHAWFDYLKIPPIYVEGCCGYHRDCWETRAYYRHGQWWALYRPFATDPKSFNKDARFIPIPPGSVESPAHLYKHYNLTGRPVLCALPHVPPNFGRPSVYCFVPPPTSF
ncbi:MAG TPA: hypothetical protein VFN42_06825 [Acetobacteraceae bacterium]|nr:hypothetical protein [Acetobacteraceae bacterium]